MIKVGIIIVLCVGIVVFIGFCRGYKKYLQISIALVALALLLGYCYFSEIKTDEVTDKGVNLIEISEKTYTNDCYSCSVGEEAEKYDGKNKVKVTNCNLELLESIDTKEGKGEKIRNTGKEFKLYNIDVEKAKKYHEDGFKTDTYELSIKLYLNYDGKKVLAGEIRCYRLSELSGEKFSDAEIDKIKTQITKIFKDKSLSEYELFGKFNKVGSDNFRIEGGMYPESGFFQTDYTTQISECNELWGNEKDFLSWCNQFNSVDFHQGQEYKEGYNDLIMVLGIVIFLLLVYWSFKKPAINKEEKEV